MKKTGTIIKYVLIVLFFLVILSSYMSSGFYAKYISSNSGSDSARVARFKIGENFDGIMSEMFSLELEPGSEFEIIITNESEVAVSCKLTVNNVTDNLPIFDKVDIINIDALDSEEKKMVIKWDESYNSKDYAGKVDIINVSLVIEQID